MLIMSYDIIFIKPRNWFNKRVTSSKRNSFGREIINVIEKKMTSKWVQQLLSSPTILKKLCRFLFCDFSSFVPKIHLENHQKRDVSHHFLLNGTTIYSSRLSFLWQAWKVCGWAFNRKHSLAAVTPCHSLNMQKRLCRLISRIFLLLDSRAWLIEAWIIKSNSTRKLKALIPQLFFSLRIN